MGFYLLDHRNRHAAGGFHGYSSRRGHGIAFIVVHTAENLPDFKPPDTGAESVARYFASTDRPASAHEVVDTNGAIRLLPDHYTAFHARNYNQRGWGIELATRAASWGQVPEQWAGLLLDQAARRCARVAKEHRIPAVRRSKAEIDRGARGFTAHADLDPKRRSDPGPRFPWARFLSLVNAYMQGKEVDDDVDEATMRRIFREELKVLIEGDPNTDTGGTHPHNLRNIIRATNAIKTKLGA